MNKRPRRYLENTALIIALIFTVNTFYSLFMDHSEHSLMNDILKPKGYQMILAIILVLSICWGWKYYATKKFTKNYFLWIDFLIENESLPIELRDPISKLKKAHNDNIISQDELFKKLIPASNSAEEILEGLKSKIEKTRNKEDDFFIQKRIDLIKQAHEDGILTNEEMNKRLRNIK